MGATHHCGPADRASGPDVDTKGRLGPAPPARVIDGAALPAAALTAVGPHVERHGQAALAPVEGPVTGSALEKADPLAGLRKAARLRQRKHGVILHRLASSIHAWRLLSTWGVGRGMASREQVSAA